MRGRRTYWTVGIAAAFCLRTAMAQSGDVQADHPFYTGQDGSKAWVEITHSGNRAKAVPVLSISRESMERIKTSSEVGGGSAAALVEGKEKAGKERVDIGNLLKQQTSRMVREGPEGVSFGGAFDLVGDIQEAWEEGTSIREKRDAVVRALKHVPMEGEPIAERAEHGDRPARNLSGKPAVP